MNWVKLMMAMNVFEETPCRLHHVVNIFEEAPCNDKGSGRSQEDIFTISFSIFLSISIFSKSVDISIIDTALRYIEHQGSERS